MTGGLNQSLSRAVASALGLGRPFFLLLIAGFLSDIGGFATQTALVLHIYRLTGGSTAYMGLVALATLGPMMLSAPIGGVWAERFPRLRIMIANDLFRIPVVLLMMATENVPLLLLLQSLVCASTALFMPARQALFPDILEPQQLELGNAVNGGMLSVGHVLSPILGALVYARGGSFGYVVALEALTYAASALLLSRLKEPSRQVKAQPYFGLWRDIRDGFRYVRGEPDLRQIFIILLASSLGFGLMIPLLRPFIKESLHEGDAVYAALVAWFGAGGVFGPPIGFVMGRSLGLGRTLLICFFLDAVVFTLWSWTTTLWSSCALIFTWGVVVFGLIPCYTSYLHTFAKKEFMGRTFALFDQTSYLPQILAAGLVATLGDRLPGVKLLNAAGIVYIAVVLMTLPSSGGHMLRRREARVFAVAKGSSPSG